MLMLDTSVRELVEAFLERAEELLESYDLQDPTLLRYLGEDLTKLLVEYSVGDYYIYSPEEEE